MYAGEYNYSGVDDFLERKLLIWFTIQRNCRSLNRNFDAVEDYRFPLDHNLTAIGCYETWLQDIICQLYTIKKGGGICLLLKLMSYIPAVTTFPYSTTILKVSWK